MDTFTIPKHMENLNVQEKITILSPEYVWWIEHLVALVWTTICTASLILCCMYINIPDWIFIICFVSMICAGYLIITGKIFWSWNSFYFMKKTVNDKKIADAARKLGENEKTLPE